MPEIVIDFLKTQGLLGILIIGLLYLYGKKFIATGRELVQVVEMLQRERAERERERTELRQELSFWRDLAWTNSKVADQVVGRLPKAKESP